ncbi:MAG: LLM class flavin-dependent oxidoreductase, partial [Rhodospirillaceae bacterium]|nr:LLM class flavin-dependent oxidoreductase [Rhodospirillaceae bacterium]
LGDVAPRDLVGLSQQVERCGFSDLWFAEDYFMLSGFASAGMALQATDTIDVGIGAVSNRVRHPAVTAMEASTLANAYPGRFTLGIGHGVPFWVAQMHLTPKSVLGSMREAITDVKRLLAGESLTQAGAYYGYDEVTLTHPAPDLQVLGAAVGPKSVDLCAVIADGMVLSAMAGPRYVATVRERIANVRRECGLPEDVELVTYALASVGEDRAAARAKVRPMIAFYLEAMGPTLITGVYDANEALAGMIEAGGAAAIEADMPDDWLDWLAVAGPPDDCRAGIEALFEAGATRVVLCVVPSEELPTQLEILGSEVLPGL